MHTLFESYFSGQIDSGDGELSLTLKPVDGRNGIRRLRTSEETVKMLPAIMDGFVQIFIRGIEVFLYKEMHCHPDPASAPGPLWN